tara:strand:+ start:38 stop:583 length:546 start_codon:yes stop_codon:yes gene_type:complete
MKNFIMTAMAVVLFSATANANTISVKCGDYVQRGTVKLANPPVMNCADLELLQKYLGSGITVGPDSKVEELVAAITSIQPAPKAQPVPPVTTEKFVVTENNLKLEDSGVNIRREDSYGQRPLPRENIGDLDDFSRKTFPGQNRTGNRRWFSELDSTKCQGWIDLNDILSGRCGSVQVNMTR